ncbi:helix-turn-helix domain-containing protein [Burkholderia seminalis]|uniref:helix-turn-helix domain-containing protein n=1 Tax=Burkholderia seminalis TaxID=488731 RepID=UPI0009F389A7|nr:helix-turn-helix domain-containing protein [Burkholderia seminalis]
MARVDATTMATALRVILARQPGNSASRQRERLLQAFSAFGRVTTVEAMRFLDILDPRARVCELRKRGYQIATVTVARASESGVTHAVGDYVLLSTAPRAAALRNDGDWVQMNLPMIYPG